MSECERCGLEYEELTKVELVQPRELCEPCIEALSQKVEYYDWRDKYTEEQHERALEEFDKYDEIECVISSYEDGQIVIHTEYVTSDVITDFCNHFGYRIISFCPRWENDGVWPCEEMHGNMYEIVLEYNELCPPPMPIDVTFGENHIENVDENDKQF